MRFGPVPLEIYEMAKGDPIYLADLGADRYPWTLSGFRLQLATNDAPDMTVLSESDMAALQDGFGRSREMTFNERTAATHGRDWQNADLGLMRYEDMFDDPQARADAIAYLREAGPRLRL